MNIGVVYMGEFPPQRGASGAARRVRDIARGLAAQGHTVHMLVPRRHQAGALVIHVDNLTIHYSDCSADRKMNLMERGRFWRHVCDVSVVQGFAWLLFYDTLIDSLGPALWLKQAGFRLAAEFCDLRSSVASLNKPKELMRSALIEIGNRLLPKTTNLNIVISDYLRERVMREAPHVPILQIPILVDPGLFSPSEEAGSSFRTKWRLENMLIIAYIGGLWFHEGVTYLVRAFARLSRSHPNARLVIAGRLKKEPGYDDVPGLINELGLSDVVITTDWIDTDEVIALLSAADVLAVPQTGHVFSQAGLPTKLAEYSAMGKAIVATRVGDVPKYFRHGVNALLCEPEDVAGLHDALDSLLNKPALRDPLGRAAQKTAYSEFDYRVAGHRIEQAMLAIKAVS